MEVRMVQRRAGKGMNAFFILLFMAAAGLAFSYLAEDYAPKGKALAIRFMDWVSQYQLSGLPKIQRENESDEKASDIGSHAPETLEFPSFFLVEGEVDYYAGITDEHFLLLNRERQAMGLAPLSLNKNLTAAAAWVAATSALTGETPATEEIIGKLSPYPELAVTPFSLNRVWATDTKSNRFINWFADGRKKDVAASAALRENILNDQITQAGLACVGTMVRSGNKEEYRLVYVWIFMQESPPAGITRHHDIAYDNITELNKARAGRNLSTLRTHATLNDLAYTKAKDILENLPFNGLAHESVRLGTPHEMIVSRISPQPLATAENLWTQWGNYQTSLLAETAEKAHTGLMNSEGHRKNMLTPDFTHIGVGVAAGIVEGHYKVVLVQLFIRER
jgi:uncharacterized protein YkwD